MIRDVKKLLSNESELIYTRKGKEIVKQLYETFLSSAEFYLERHRLRTLLNEVKSKYNTVLLENDKLANNPPPQKKWWQFGSNSSTPQKPNVKSTQLNKSYQGSPQQQQKAGNPTTPLKKFPTSVNLNASPPPNPNFPNLQLPENHIISLDQAAFQTIPNNQRSNPPRNPRQ